jgi:two-component system, NarL family, sensor histidine kinase UhpB
MILKDERKVKYFFEAETAVMTDKFLHILLLEDNESDAELIARELKDAGLLFTETRIETKESFLAELRGSSIDIILADYSMPQFTAIEAFEILQELHSSVPVILVTGSQSEEVAVDCMKRGADDYILKQSLTRLPSAVRNVLDKKRIEKEKENAENALKKSETKFRLLFKLNPIPMLIYDTKSLAILEVNNAAAHHYGYSGEEFDQMWITDLWALEDLDKLQEVRTGGSGPVDISGVWTHQRKNGESRTVEIVSQPLEAVNRQTALLIIEDITERTLASAKLRASHEQLRALSAHLQSVREEERARIAREIHDELGQVLTAIRMDLSWLFNKFRELGSPLPQALGDHVISMTNLVDTTIKTIRRISTELRPRILDDLGLVAAIEWQSHEFETRTGISCEFKSNVEDISLDHERSTAVFRILQESLTNVARHSQATNVDIIFHAENKTLSLMVSDNGKGIEPVQPPAPQTFGLLGMKERAFLLGGTLTIERGTKQGTTVSLSLPVRENEKSSEER